MAALIYVYIYIYIYIYIVPALTSIELTFHHFIQSHDACKVEKDQDH